PIWYLTRIVHLVLVGESTNGYSC
ncbi:hypothetical protein CCACVL1_01740, partial [Corchorus capsularis]